MNKKKTVVLDIRGQICPSSLLLTLKELNGNAAAVRSGVCELVVLTDDHQATTTIPAAAGKMGFAATVDEADQGHRIRICAR